MKITHLAFFSAALATVFGVPAFAQISSAPSAPAVGKSLDAQKIFSPYIGTWKGETKIMNAEKQPINVLEVEQRYQWGKGAQGGVVLLGEAVYTAKVREGKSLTIKVQSRTAIQDGKIVAELTQGKEKEQFTAFVDEDGFLVFLPEETPVGKTPEKLSASRVETEKDVTAIRVRGFEKITLPGKDGAKETQTVLLLEGRLVKQPEATR